MKSSIILLLAKEEIQGTVNRVQKEYNLRPCVMEGILSAVTLDCTEKVQKEVAEDVRELLEQKNEELEKAKAAAKKVLNEADAENE
ncbi:MAG: hypothetical protein ACLSCO_19085 [Gallintestinimicrobium sp.]